MATITAKDVAALRERTGAGMMDCKKALMACEGEVEKAIDFLREKGLAAAAKKAGRIAAEGVVADYRDGDVAVLVEVNCETDFVAKTDKFLAFVKQIAKQIADTNPADVEALMATTMDGDTVEHAVSTAVAGIGEKISIRRFARYECGENGFVDSYIHMGGKVGVFSEICVGDDSVITKPEFADFAKNINMQIAASRPGWVNEEDVPQAELDRETEIIKNKALEEGKPEKIIMERIVPGQVKNFYKMNCLVDQEYIKDEDLSVKQYIEKTAKELGTELAVVRFTRFTLGEGIEKKQDDFAEEVRKQAGL